MFDFLNIRFFLLTLLIVQFGFSQNKIPHLQKKGNKTQLMVNEKPFLVLGGELGNSSATSMESMENIWPKLKDMKLNTVLTPVYWELIEKEEGKFDFSLVDDLILRARKEDLKLVFLWFGSWKNSMSSHAPAWVKLNQKKYPRIKNDKNKSHEILTPFSENNLKADINAFQKLMAHLRDFDQKEQTVIMIQVENEIGMLPTARDYCPQANEAFNNEVPAELVHYLQKNKERLAPEFLEIWKVNGFKTKGNWEQVFGKSLQTDEIFMAWYFSKFTNAVAKAGKDSYAIPMFVNAALNAAGKKPGEYPSAGPLPHLMDTWKAAGNSVDFLSPDFYNPLFKYWNDLFTRQGDPLFIPEHKFDKTAPFKGLYAIGHYEAIGFSPFSIESVEDAKKEPLGKIYDLAQQLTPVIEANKGLHKIDGVLLDKENQSQIVQLGDYEFTFKHDYTLNWSDDAKEATWPMTSAIIIELTPNEFYIAGSGIVVTFKPVKDTTRNAGILKVDQGTFENKVWKTFRHFNGDQTHQGRHVRIAVGDYEIQKVQLYTYE
ncbi:Beta-galactosidase GanA [Flavobacterium aquidurense]|uniref:Mannonate dehydratase n=2 Tax=Flavobacterium frigidimaris TaxID=262320 RepID=A0ABX4BTD1_FLAFR|nr:mannonate dehydratase [Flavobacterium frigidimaris]SDY49191.1 Beta-galactosidase GanA [Flavobacterium aquidurense]